MDTSFKKIMFIILGLTIIITGFCFVSMPGEARAAAAAKENQKFDDWVANCSKDKDNKNPTCVLTQQLTSATDNKIEILAIYQIGYFGNNKDKELKIVQRLPVGVAILPGTGIISDKTLIAPGKFTTCAGVWCDAIADITEKDLKTLLDSKNNMVSFMNSEGKQVNFPLPIKGLKEGIKVLKE